MDWTGITMSAYLQAMRAREIVAAIGVCVVAVAVAPAGTGARSATPPTSTSIVTAPGRTDAVIRHLRLRGVRVDRRVGRRLQVVTRTAGARRALAAISGVSTVGVAPSAYGDAIVGQGVDRTGASALSDVADDGRGLRIAVIDLGFGDQLGVLQARGELPPPARLELRSFDPAGGIPGTNAYGNPTNHGELVAQAIFDYAPRAHYVFVSYHTPDDFVAAVDWLATQAIDVAVHSNNFLDGPFDGTSPMARAVDRAAAAGVSWFNSAGNYGGKHWSGPWTDRDGDDVLDWPGSEPWTMTHGVGEPVTFHLSWTQPPGGIRSDVDLVLERLAGAAWEEVAVSAAAQRDGAPPAERINGFRPTVAGVFRLRARHVAGPVPSGDLHLYSREDELPDWAGLAPGSVPTPADAAGSISVGAVDWRSNSLVRYSSRGPTPDGRTKPDLVAPTGTRLATPGGDPRDVGGTSIAAPNAAGAAALALAAQRAAGRRPSAAQLRRQLVRDAIDLGTPGADAVFGAGRIRVDREPPELRTAIAPPRTPTRGTIAFSVDASDAGPVATWGLDLDRVRLATGRVARERINFRLPTSAIADGVHTVGVAIGDAVGNVGTRTWRVVIDNTAPVVDPPGVTIGAPVQVAVSGRMRRRYPVFVRVGATDAQAGALQLEVSVIASGGRVVASRRLSVRGGTTRAFGAGRVAAGAYRMRISATDVAGNRGSITVPIRVPGAS